MEQHLYNAHFNLRERKADKPTNIYCVVYLQGKQYRFATGVKVLPCQWDKKRQVAIISNVQSIVDNYNNNIVNEKLEELKEIEITLNVRVLLNDRDMDSATYQELFDLLKELNSN